MSDNLSRGATALVLEGRQALRPTDADKARILSAIQSRLATGTVTTDKAPAPTAGAPADGLAIGKLTAFAASVLAAVAAFVVLAEGPATDVQQPEVVLTPSASVTISGEATTRPEASAPLVQSTLPAPIAAPPAAALRTGSRINDSDHLAEEVVLLTRAEKEFHAGNLKRALTATDEHRQKFPKGVLTQERNSLRLQVLCGLGRHDEARSEAKRLGRLAMGSARSAEVCGGED